MQEPDAQRGSEDTKTRQETRLLRNVDSRSEMIQAMNDYAPKLTLSSPVGVLGERLRDSKKVHFSTHDTNHAAAQLPGADQASLHLMDAVIGQ